MNVLVIGGTGFVGGAVVRRLLQSGHSVAAFHRGETSVPKTIRGDRKDLASHREAFRRFAPEVVVDTIAYTEADGLTLTKAFRGIARRFVVLSSQDVYAAYGRLLRLETGAAERRDADEDSALRSSRYPYRAKAEPGEMAYDYDKILVEAAVQSAADAPVTILRLPKVYGPGDPHRRLKPYISQMAGGVPEVLVDRAKAGWRWTRGAVEDVAEAIVLASRCQRARDRSRVQHR